MVSFPLIFFSEGGGLRNALIPLLGESGKKGMYCKCVRNGDMSSAQLYLYTNQGVFRTAHPVCVEDVGHVSDMLQTCTAFTRSVFRTKSCVHTGCPHRRVLSRGFHFAFVQDKMNKKEQYRIGGVSV